MAGCSGAGRGAALRQATLVLPPPAAAFVGEGGRDVPFDRVADTAGPLRPGAAIRLRLPSGDDVGLAIADPENGRLRLMIRAGEPFEEIDSAFLAARVETALEKRRALGLVARGSAFRLLNGAGDGLPGLAADVFGGWAVLHVYGRALVPCARRLADVLIGGVSLRGVVLKLRGRGAAARGEVRQEVRGDAPPERLVVEERGLRFEVHLLGGLNVGLFTDMREHRHELARFAAGRSVLNGFSYTGTLSVAAAAAGAAAVTSVDLSSGVQRWARDNFRLNGLVPRRPCFRFETGDVSRTLAREADVGRRYDLVLLDPPTYSAARGAPFALERDYPALVASACRLLPPGGLLWLAANARRVDLEALAREGLAEAGRTAVRLEAGGLPEDHPTLAAQPEDRYLQVLVLRVE
jgi:23S rRNA (cytosine1962-C5)-methyltransferase